MDPVFELWSVWHFYRLHLMSIFLAVIYIYIFFNTYWIGSKYYIVYFAMAQTSFMNFKIYILKFITDVCCCIRDMPHIEQSVRGRGLKKRKNCYTYTICILYSIERLKQSLFSTNLRFGIHTFRITFTFYICEVQSGAWLTQIY